MKLTEDEYKQIIGEALKKARNEKGMKQSEVSNIASVKQSNISRYETADINVPGSHLALLMEVYGKTMGTIDIRISDYIKQQALKHNGTLYHPEDGEEPAYTGEELAEKMKEAVSFLKSYIPAMKLPYPVEESLIEFIPDDPEYILTDREMNRDVSRVFRIDPGYTRDITGACCICGIKYPANVNVRDLYTGFVYPPTMYDWLEHMLDDTERDTLKECLKSDENRITAHYNCILEKADFVPEPGDLYYTYRKRRDVNRLKSAMGSQIEKFLSLKQEIYDKQDGLCASCYGPLKNTGILIREMEDGPYTPENAIAICHVCNIELKILQINDLTLPRPGRE